MAPCPDVEWLPEKSRLAAALLAEGNPIQPVLVSIRAHARFQEPIAVTQRLKRHRFLQDVRVERAVALGFVD